MNELLYLNFKDNSNPLFYTNGYYCYKEASATATTTETSILKTNKSISIHVPFFYFEVQVVEYHASTISICMGLCNRNNELLHVLHSNTLKEVKSGDTLGVLYQNLETNSTQILFIHNGNIISTVACKMNNLYFYAFVGYQETNNVHPFSFKTNFGFQGRFSFSLFEYIRNRYKSDLDSYYSTLSKELIIEYLLQNQYMDTAKMLIEQEKIKNQISETIHLLEMKWNFQNWILELDSTNYLQTKQKEMDWWKEYATKFEQELELLWFLFEMKKQDIQLEEIMECKNTFFKSKLLHFLYEKEEYSDSVSMEQIITFQKQSILNLLHQSQCRFSKIVNQSHIVHALLKEVEDTPLLFQLFLKYQIG